MFESGNIFVIHLRPSNLKSQLMQSHKLYEDVDVMMNDDTFPYAHAATIYDNLQFVN